MADDRVMEERQELMVSPKHPNPTPKFAHFLKPASLSTTIKKPFSLNPRSLPKNHSLNGFNTLQKGWKDWVNYMEPLHKHTWQKAGICNALLNSSYDIIKNNDLILGFAQKWCHETKTFVFKWSEVGISLEDMMVFGGYSVLGQSIVFDMGDDESKRLVEKLYEAMSELNKTSLKKPSQCRWMVKFKESESEIEHEAFLTLWLSRLALAPAVLASIYRDLSFLRNKIGVEHNDETNVVVWAPFQLVQIWILERFPKISLNWVDSCNPRFARWEKKKLSAENVGAIVDCGLEDFCWQPYGNVYKEKGRSVDVVGECLDEELESWVRCIRICELVGIEGKCIEQYLPHRVARQFGMSQDVPVDVPRANLTHEIAWRFYTRPVKDVKLYIPSQHPEPCVTVRYMEWWNKSNGECSLQSSDGNNKTEDYCMGDDDIYALAMEIKGRISKVEKQFAYLKAKKNGVTSYVKNSKTYRSLDAESDVEGVSDTVFGDQDDKPGQEQAPIQSPKDKELSSDPFNLYDLLNKQDKGETNSGLGSSIPFPPGFTPERINTRNDAHEDIVSDHDKSKCRSDGFGSRIVEDDQPLNEHLSFDSPDVGHGYKKGGSVLEVLDDMIKIGQTMGFSMEGCKKDMENIIGYLGGILSVRDPSVFRKKQHIISDNFLLYMDLGFQISRWNGECMVMGDFNEVRCLEERMGSVFNVQRANAFNNFISNSRLVEIQLEGFSFTWSHSSATKMSKLDRFLVSEDLMKQLQDIKSSDGRDYLQKAKIKWAIEGDENSKFFHGIINRKRANLAIKGVMVDGEWVDEPCRVKEEFRLHFATQFQTPGSNFCKLNFSFPDRLNSDQVIELECPVTKEEIKKAVWGCGENKSSGPDGYTFEFFCKFWDTIGSDLCVAVEWFFEHNLFTKGCNSSFVALIPKTHDPKFVNDYRPISLIGSLYKVVAKVLATRLSSIIPALISDVQTAFLPNRQILDGPFIINELLSWCKHKKQQAMMFKIDFAKAYDSIRWDYLDDVLRAFGFGSKWCSWISGCLHSGMASVLLNGSPTLEFQFQCGLKQGDPLAPYLFILIMKSLDLSFSRAIDAGIFKGIQIGSSFNISHLFFADDAIFIGEWSTANLSGITRILHCFSLLSGLKINLIKSQLLSIGISNDIIAAAALTSRAWDDTINKLKARLSNWKLKTLFVGGRLKLLKSVLGSSPIYTMSIYKVLASKKFGGLGVSSFFALNRALLFKWVWRFISRDHSLWCRFITSIHGFTLSCSSPFRFSTWNTIIQEVNLLKDRGADLLSHCHIRVGNGLTTQFWNDVLIGDSQLRLMFPRIYALEINKGCTVAEKLQNPVTLSLRRTIRGGVEASQLDHLIKTVEATILTNLEDRWVWDLNGEGVFRVKDARSLLDDCFFLKILLLPEGSSSFR
nr:RNA-directed DNA polymerase, eukaryota [Tanacetum cinerariifolium]